MILAKFIEPTQMSPNAPFLTHLDDEGMVAYHGTSSIFERAIDVDGLVPGSSPFTLHELQAVLDIFRTLRWHGLSTASRAVLEPFSLQYDRSADRPPRVFFAEHAFRATMYASHDFAGGEAARSLRYSFAELDQYFSEERVPREQTDNLIRQASLRGIPYCALTDDERESALKSLHGLQDVRDRAIAISNRHTHGVIYAIHFRPEDLRSLILKGQMGIECTATVSPDQLVAKTYVPNDFFIRRYFDPYIFDLPIWTGLLRLLRGDA